MALSPLDWLVAAFTAGLTLVLAGYRPPEAPWIVAAHVLILAVVCLAPRARRGFHYAIDAVAGFLLAAIVLAGRRVLAGTEEEG